MNFAAVCREPRLSSASATVRNFIIYIFFVKINGDYEENKRRDDN